MLPEILARYQVVESHPRHCTRHAAVEATLDSLLVEMTYLERSRYTGSSPAPVCRNAFLSLAARLPAPDLTDLARLADEALFPDCDVAHFPVLSRALLDRSDLPAEALEVLSYSYLIPLIPALLDHPSATAATARFLVLRLLSALARNASREVILPVLAYVASYLGDEVADVLTTLASESSLPAEDIVHLSELIAS